MQYFIGIVPPVAYKNRIINFQSQWKNNTIMEVVEPHITLKAQGGLTEDLLWLDNVQNLCEKIEPFTIQIDRPKFFGRDILYLSCQSNELIEFHNQIVATIKPDEELIQKYFEREHFIAHMTLGKTYYGLRSNELDEMAIIAEEQLSPYPTITVSSIRVYQELEPMRYITYLDIPLGKNS